MLFHLLGPAAGFELSRLCSDASAAVKLATLTKRTDKGGYYQQIVLASQFKADGGQRRLLLALAAALGASFEDAGAMARSPDEPSRRALLRLP
jgi:hypothetical protein